MVFLAWLERSEGDNQLLTDPGCFYPLTGTGLGDPIEVGAAVAVLGRRPTTRAAQDAKPLTLITAKTWIGHAEPAAGVMGLLHATAAITHRAELALLHLHSCSVHVAGALGTCDPGAMRAPRQLGPKPGSGSASLACGVSAFAFQGTNAHAIVRSSHVSETQLLSDLSHAHVSHSGSHNGGASKAAGRWCRESYWLHPASSPLITAAVLTARPSGRLLGGMPRGAAHSPVVFEFPLDSSLLAPYLYSLETGGVQALPPSLLLHLAAAAVRLARGATSATAGEVLLQSGTLSLLSPPTLSSSQLVQKQPRWSGCSLQAVLDPASGTVKLLLVTAEREAAPVQLLSASAVYLPSKSTDQASNAVVVASVAPKGSSLLHKLASSAVKLSQAVPACVIAVAASHEQEEPELLSLAAMEAGLQLSAFTTTAAPAAGKLLSSFESCRMLQPVRDSALPHQQTHATCSPDGLMLDGVAQLARPIFSHPLLPVQSSYTQLTSVATVVDQALSEDEDEQSQYVVEWVADAVSHSLTSSSVTATAQSSLFSLHSKSSCQASSGSLFAAAAASAAVIKARTQPEFSSVDSSLITTGAFGGEAYASPLGHASNSAGAALGVTAWAMMRVGLQEQSTSSTSQLTAGDIHPSTPQQHHPTTIPALCAYSFSAAASTESAIAQVDGMYGSSSGAGVSFSARLCRSVGPNNLLLASAAATAAAIPTRLPSMQVPAPKRGTYIVTGGSGLVAGHVAFWLCSLGATTIHLVSRSGRLPKGLLERVASTSSTARPCTFLAVSADTGCLADADAVFGHHGVTASSLAKQSGDCRDLGDSTLLGVLHAAGVLEDATISNLTLPALRRVLAAKLGSSSGVGSWSHAALLQPTASQVMFSSVATLLGSPGQASYAAANAVLDVAASRLHSQGVPASSIRFGAWAGGGMAAANVGIALRMSRLGLTMLQPEQAMQAVADAAASTVNLPRSLRPAPASLGASGVSMLVRWRVFLQTAGAKSAGSPFFDNVRPALLSASACSAPQDASLSVPRQSTSSHAAAQATAIQQHIQTEVQSAIRALIGDNVGPDEPLMAAGLDSLGAVELLGRLESALGLSLSQTLVFDHPTASALSAYLTVQAIAAAAKDSGEAYTVAAEASQLQMPLARFHQPGAAVAQPPHSLGFGILATAERSPLPRLSVSDLDPVRVVPASRWDVEAAVGKDVGSRFGAFLPDVGLFDASAFGISAGEGMLMDPQQRLLLEVSYEVLTAASNRAAASPPPSTLSPSQAAASSIWSSSHASSRGVYVGIASSDYGALVATHSATGAYHATANAVSVAAGRLSYSLALTGPALNIDTACSASLVALHLGCRDLAEDRVGGALVAGAHVQATRTSTSYVWAASMLSPSGR